MVEQTGPEIAVVYEASQEMQEQIAGANLEITPYGRDALVFIVYKDNSVDLTTEQLVGIYTGAITDWSEVGGTPGPFVAYQRNEGSGSQILFLKLLMMDNEPMETPTELRPEMMGGLIDFLAIYDGSGGALGYSVYFYASEMYTNPDLKLLSLDGVAPNNETLGNGSYPFTNDFFLVIRAGAPELSPARILRDWMLSEEGLRVLEEAGYVTARS